jgi:uncharacterized protein YggU (UPF0235/DUF167 family)
MRLDIRVVPGSSRTAVKQENSVLKVYLTKSAHGNEANVQLIQVLAGYLGIKKYQLDIIKGHTCRNKVVQINDDANPGIKK